MTGTDIDLVAFLEFSNRVLTTTIVITAFSLLLYNLARNLRDRVTRASGGLLACITVAYLVESVIGLNPRSPALEEWLRFQWVGIAFLPATMLHLADALLSTTGLISRGRRRRVVRILYLISFVITIGALFTPTFASDLRKQPVPHMSAGSWFHLYTLYFVLACVVSFWLVNRARDRCLTTGTRRRMTYLQLVFLTPALGVFPYNMLSSSVGSDIPVVPLAVVSNLANMLVILMLSFMSYPLSYFGTNRPDRVVKADLLQFFLRGPITAVMLLLVMLMVPRIAHLLNLTPDTFVLIAVVGMLMLLQWMITVLTPPLESWLIYNEQQQEARQLQRFSQALLTHSDTVQLEEAILAAICNLLQVPTAFIATITPEEVRLERAIGYFPRDVDRHDLNSSLTAIAHRNGNGYDHDDDHHVDTHHGNGDVIAAESDSLKRDDESGGGRFSWRKFWLYPLKEPNAAHNAPLLGILGIWKPDPDTVSTEETDEQLHSLINQVARILADLRLQNRLFETLNELMTEIEDSRSTATVTPFGHLQSPSAQPVDVADLNEWVRGALRDFWGGPRLAESMLLRLNVVQARMEEHNGSPIQALRSVITDAIESLKPEGEHDLNTTEWLMYNILEMRYLRGKKVQDVAPRLAMSDANFYRKQKVAIEEVARRIGEMEKEYSEAYDGLWTAEDG